MDQVVITVQRLADEQVAAAGAAVARAFQEDLAARYVLPHAGRRQRVLRELLAGYVRYGHRFGEAYTTAGTPQGVALWLPPPGRKEPGVQRALETGLPQAALGIGLLGLLRGAPFGLHLHFRDRNVFREPHWYLWLLGVDPAHQGQGIGGALLQPVLERADGEGLPCLLHTMAERNVRFYQQQGFQVVYETKPPFGAPITWAMRREPERR